MNRNLIIAIVVIVLIILGVTLYWQFSGTGSFDNQTGNVIDSQNQQETRLMTALHQFRNGRHIVAGEVDLPTPCHDLNYETVVTQTSPQQVMINFTTNSNNADVCAQVLTAARYKVEFQAAENAVIQATWNGGPVQLNLVPVPAGDDLNDFEVFIKG